MPWFPVDDRFHSHSKPAACSLAALGLWTLAGSWAADHLTDGDVPVHMVTLLSRGAAELADELVAVGLWRRTKTGYRFHEWHSDADGSVRNRTRSEVIAQRSKQSIGGVIGNHRRWHTGDDGKPDPNCTFCGPDQAILRSVPDRSTDRSTEGGTESVPNPPMPIPIPNNPPTPQGGKRGRAYGYDADPDFVRFWDVYPQKSAKPAAFKAWGEAIKRGADPETVIKAAQRYRDDPRRNPDKTKYPQGWLNDERYKDQVETRSSSGGWWDN